MQDNLPFQPEQLSEHCSGCGHVITTIEREQQGVYRLATDYVLCESCGSALYCQS